MSPSDEKDFDIFGPQQREEESQDAWLMSYADMITLLLGFFAVLLSMSTFNTVKMEMFSQYFSGQPKRITMSQLEAQIEQFAKEEHLIGQVEARLTSRGVEINFKDKLMFDLGKADLKEEAVPILTKIANLLKFQEINERKVLVEGHTDSLPIRSKVYPTNWELSTGRAGVVVRFFLSQGLDPQRFQAAGYADTRPENPNTDSVRGQPENRRVVVVITPESYISEQEILRQAWSVKGSTANLNYDFSKYKPVVECVPISQGSAKSAVEEQAAVPAPSAAVTAQPSPAGQKKTAAQVKQAKVQNKAVQQPAAEEKKAAPASAPKPVEKAPAPVSAPVPAQKPVVPKPAAKSIFAPEQPSTPKPAEQKPAPAAAPAGKDISAENGAKQDDKKVAEYYAAGLKYLNDGNKEQALNEFEKVLAINPKHTPSLIKVKKLKQELGK